MRDSNTALIFALTTVCMIVVSAIVVLAIWGSPSNALATSAVTTITTLITIIIAGLLSLKQSADAKHAAVASQAVGEANALALVAVDAKIDGNTETTNQTGVTVNGRMTELIETVRKLAEVQQQLAAAQALAQGIAIGRDQVASITTSTPPDVPPDAPAPDVKR